MSTTRPNRNLVLTAAVAAAIGAMVSFSSTANAQQRVGGDGKLMDASNRVGSGGFNDNSASALPPGVFGNALVNGDVTGGQGFRGNLPYFDAGAFHGTLPGAFVSNFAAQSTNVQTNGTIINNAQNVHLFLGDNRGVNPPSNFVSTGAQPGYIPAAPTSDLQYTSDSRLGTPDQQQFTSLVPSAIFQTGGTAAGGGISTYKSASPLLGIRNIQNAQQSNGTVSFADTIGGGPLNNLLGTKTDPSGESRLAGVNDTTNSDLMPMSDSSAISTGSLGTVTNFATPRTGTGSLATGAAGAANPNGPNGSAAGSNPGTLSGTGPLNAQQQNSAGSASLAGTPVSAAVPSGYPLTSSLNGQPMSGSINTGEDSSTNIFSPTSNAPGSAYMRMIRRLKAINNNAPLTPVERSLLNQAKAQDIKAAQDQSKIKNDSGSPTNQRTGMPGDMGAPGRAQPGGASPNNLTTGGSPSGASPSGPVLPQQVGTDTQRVKPIIVKTFTEDESSRGTRELLAKAEDFMKQGKFTSALEEYDLVEQQAPAQPFVQLARANAELGASYYGLAEAHLRQAFLSDQALLSAQLDLRSFLGEDKLQYLVKDLKQIAQANPNESRPVFLLSYICYNTNNARGAAAYLDLAEKREGKPDPFFKLLRQHWDLPDISVDKPDDSLNK